MSACAQTGPSLDICPTADEILPRLLALLPRGRAWGTHDGGPFPGSTLYGFWSAVAVVLAWFNAAICAMVLEFFCATTVQMRDLWLYDYSLPDGCDPFPDLCTKVSALGGTRCDYYTAISAQAGWSIDCASVAQNCGARAGRAKAGCAVPGQSIPAGVLVIRVHLAASPAFTGIRPASSAAPLTLRPVPRAGRLLAGQSLACQGNSSPSIPQPGRLKAGQRLGCKPDIAGLVCLIERITGAHMTIRYEVLP